MRTVRFFDTRFTLTILCIGFLFFTEIHHGYCGTITVNTNADNTTADAFITLREAIILSNQGAAGLGRALTTQELALISGSYGAGIADNINFAGSYTINLAIPLPTITDANTVINGYSAPGAIQNTNPATSTLAGLNSTIKVRLMGNGGVDDGLSVQANGCIIKGLSLTNFNNSGIIWLDTGTQTSGKVEGCYLGVTPAGALGFNFYGVTILSNNTNIKIGGTTPAARNLISGNIVAGVFIDGGSYCTVMGNLIGTNADGMSPLGNKDGILFDGNSIHDTIGGVYLSQRNIISGNDENGITINSEGSDYTVIKNNFIGLGRDGKKNVKNTSRGILVDSGADNTLIGNNWHSNYICYNNIGIYLNSATTSLTTIEMNFIGLDYEGNVAGNIGDGIHIDQAVTTTIGPKNRIAANTESGINIIASDATIIKGNFIGTDSSAVSPNFGNGVNGITIAGYAINNGIGGSVAADRNIIVFNYGYGIEISEGSAANTVSNNYVGVNANGTSDAGNGSSGIAMINAVGNTIGPNNVVSGNDENGILIYGSASKNNSIKGNLIGTTVSGANPLPNSYDGVRIENFNEPIADQNIIGGDLPSNRNIISGNSMYGVHLIGMNVTANSVKGNYIGLNAAGAAAMKNDSSGIRIDKGAHGNIIGNPNLIGTGNIISGNALDGITIFGNGTTDNESFGNIIGLNSAGTAAIPNGKNGILVTSGAMETVIGTNTNAGRNIISGNTLSGIVVTQESRADIFNNYIGTNSSGINAFGNANSGIILRTKNNHVGAEAAGFRNIISGNIQNGILISDSGATDNIIYDNWIGQNSAGNALGNGGDGIQLADSVYNTIIGGTTGTKPNVIRSNGLRGIALKSTCKVRNLISGNSIYANANLGIDIDPLFTPNPNDNNDADTGPNKRMNYPTISYANWDAGSKILTCKVRHNALPINQTYPITVQFFTGGPDSTGYGEGQTYLGQGTITSPNTTTTIDLSNINAKPAFVTSVAIDFDNNTSEFSLNYTVTVPVELSLFNATVSDKKILLSWKTESEQNNRGFEIERSETSFENNWIRIGFVDGFGTTTDKHFYSFDDQPSQTQKYFYRLKQIDFDGIYTYSQIVEADLRSAENFYLGQNYPNPFTQSTTIPLPLLLPKASIRIGEGRGEVSLKVYDIFGREVLNLSNKIENGKLTIDNSQLPATGIYFYRLTIGDQSQTRIMVMAK